jgi:hypothetical protein
MPCKENSFQEYGECKEQGARNMHISVTLSLGRAQGRRVSIARGTQPNPSVCRLFTATERSEEVLGSFIATGVCSRIFPPDRFASQWLGYFLGFSWTLGHSYSCLLSSTNIVPEIGR